MEPILDDETRIKSEIGTVWSDEEKVVSNLFHKMFHNWLELDPQNKFKTAYDYLRIVESEFESTSQEVRGGKLYLHGHHFTEPIAFSIGRYDYMMKIKYRGEWTPKFVSKDELKFLTDKRYYWNAWNPETHIKDDDDNLDIPYVPKKKKKGKKNDLS